MYNNEIGINIMIQTGFVGKRIITFESKEGGPAIRFYIWVGAKKPFGFWQMIAVYGNRAIQLATNDKLAPGDLIHVTGKKMIMNFHNKNGFSENIDTNVSVMCYILKKKEI